MNILQPKDHERYKSIADLTLLDGGKHLLYRLVSMSLKHNKNTSDLYIYDFATNISKRLTTDGNTTTFRPYNEAHILVLRKEANATVVNTIHLATGEEAHRFTLPFNVGHLQQAGPHHYAFTVSHDTLLDQEAFASDTYEDGTPKSKLYDDFYFFDELHFRSNDDGIINGLRTHLYLYDDLRDTHTRLHEADADIVTFETSQDRVIYCIADNTNPTCPTTAVFEYNLKKKKHTCLLPSGTHDLSEIFDASKGLFMIGYDVRVTHDREKPQLYKLVDGTVALIETGTYDLNKSGATDAKFAGGPLAKVDGSTLLITLCDDGVEHLARIDLQGTITPLTSGFDLIGGFDTVKDTLIMTLMSDTQLMEAFLIDTKASTPSTLSSTSVQLTHHNDKALSDFDLSPIETFTFTSHGDEIKGYVMKPTHMEAGKKYPGILFMHGGPRGLFSKVYQHKLQVLANNGYFCFFTNPHGSASRGNAFSSIWGQHGHMDYDDLMTFTDQVLARYPALDAKRLGVTGHSYGGIMTNVMIGRTNRFAAAVSSASLSNYTTKAYLTDNGLGSGMLIYGDPLKDHEWTWDHSPLKHVANIKTPTLFLHGEVDYRCTYVDALQLYTALKQHGVDTAFYLFKEEPHGIKKPRNKVKWLEALMGWFDQYLKG